jgi:hypothetical protein
LAVGGLCIFGDGDGENGAGAGGVNGEQAQDLGRGRDCEPPDCRGPGILEFNDRASLSEPR